MFHLTLNLLYEIIKQFRKYEFIPFMRTFVTFLYLWENFRGSCWEQVMKFGACSGSRRRYRESKCPFTLISTDRVLIIVSKVEGNRCSSSKTSLFPRDKWKTIGGRISTRKFSSCHRSSSPVNVATIFLWEFQGEKFDSNLSFGTKEGNRSTELFSRELSLARKFALRGNRSRLSSRGGGKGDEKKEKKETMKSRSRSRIDFFSIRDPENVL